MTMMEMTISSSISVKPEEVARLRARRGVAKIENVQVI
jgi:hypothetical protein